MREFKVYVDEVREIYFLVCSLNGVDIKEEKCGSFEDVLFSVGDFVEDIIKEYEIESRIDTLEVEVKGILC